MKKISSLTVQITKTNLREAIIRHMDAALNEGTVTGEWPSSLDVFLDLHKVGVDILAKEFEAIEANSTLVFSEVHAIYPEVEEVVHLAVKAIAMDDST